MKTLLDHAVRIWWDATDKPALIVACLLWVPVCTIAVWALIILVEGNGG